MASLCTRLSEWVRLQLSAVTTFQKQFVDDVTERVKHQKEQLDRKAREMQQRAVQRHLDSLEEKYLCCVCGKPGEAREDEEHVYDTFSMITLPPAHVIARAVAQRERTEEGDFGDRRLRRAPHANRDRHRTRSSSFFSDTALAREVTANYSDSEDEATGTQDGRASTARLDAGHTTERAYSRTTRGARRGARLLSRTDALDPSLVTTGEVQNMMYKIRHAILNKEARTKRKAVAVHRDKGLMMIDDAEVELFSLFFQRPVHGYLCAQCYTSARRRLDTMTVQIRTLLYKAEHPLLRKVSQRGERQFLGSENAITSSLLPSPSSRPNPKPGALAEINHGDDTKSILNGAVMKPTAEMPQLIVGASSARERTVQDNTEVLQDNIILGLRAHVKCGVCQRRPCSFFVRSNILFICQFCCARDRYYRDHAICINDEPMPREVALLLRSLARDYEHVYQQHALRQLPQTELAEAHTDLFGPAAEKDLFARLQPPPDALPVVARPEADVQRIAAAQSSPTTPAAIAEAEQAVARATVGQTMVSLFANTRVEPAAVDLFADEDHSPPA